MTDKKKPHVLIILDGWGYRESRENNAIANAATPTLDRLWREGPSTLVSGSGMDVGLPPGQMGNSEVGHMSLGAGRVVYQNFTRITKDIEDGGFFTNPAFTQAIDKAVNTEKAVHILGLLSPGGVHSHEDHIAAIIDCATQRGAKKVFLHAFLDGRDTPPRSAKPSLEKFDAKLRQLGVGHIATIVGRYYAMDRDNRWDRVTLAYDLLTGESSAYTATSAVAALEAAYERGDNDEFVKPTVINSEAQSAVAIEDGDSVIFMNFRSDRAREITRAFVDAEFNDFQRKRMPKLADFVTATEYAADIKAACAYPPQELHNTLGAYLADLGKTQLRIAETEKYAHVTFFFSGGQEELYPGEERILVPSPDVATYDLKPEMSAPEVTEKLVAAIKSGRFDAIICNYANGDMVGHTGIFAAAVKAAEAIDQCVEQVVAAVKETGGECLITADHGNAEMMVDPETNGIHTAHTCEPVPLLYVGPRKITLKPGTLPDIAPSLLALMELEQPKEMTGHSLITMLS